MSDDVKLSYEEARQTIDESAPRIYTARTIATPWQCYLALLRIGVLVPLEKLAERSHNERFAALTWAVEVLLNVGEAPRPEWLPGRDSLAAVSGSIFCTHTRAEVVYAVQLYDVRWVEPNDDEGDKFVGPPRYPVQIACNGGEMYALASDGSIWAIRLSQGRGDVGHGLGETWQQFPALPQD